MRPDISHKRDGRNVTNDKHMAIAESHATGTGASPWVEAVDWAHCSAVMMAFAVNVLATVRSRTFHARRLSRGGVGKSKVPSASLIYDSQPWTTRNAQKASPLIKKVARSSSGSLLRLK